MIRTFKYPNKERVNVVISFDLKVEEVNTK